jgi:hypothetical protein
MWVIILLILLILVLSRSEKETFNQDIEKLPYIRENNLQIEQYTTSHVKDLDFYPEESLVQDKLIADVYDAIVDDGRLASQKFDFIDTIDHKEYFQFDNKKDYGFTSFSNY